MKFIFLDIDGVLVNRASLMKHSGRYASADPECVAALNHILRVTGAEIILSSTWRFDPDIRDLFRQFGVEKPIRDLTPRLRGSSRGAEIAEWLSRFENCWPTVESFVIVDDGNDMDHLLPRLIQTSHEIGLTMEHAERAIVMLNEA